MLHYTFDWSVLWRQPYGKMIMEGIWTTVYISLLSLLMGLVLGVLIAVCRLTPFRVGRIIGTAYVQLFRNIPLLVQMFFWYFAVPALLPKNIEHWLNHEVSQLAYYLGVLCLGTYTASRIAETVRSGFLSVPRGLYQAAFSTGLSPWKTYRYIATPYAFRIIIPLLTTEVLSCFKNSSLAMTIGVMETTHVAGRIDSITFHGLETTTAASMVYMVITLFVVLFMGRVENRTHIPGLIQRGT
jgi:glutamate/aspartate transport system permease protein